jgi:gas vesicle protein
MFSRVRIAIRFFFVGLAVGVLLAPRSGVETRRMLRQRADRLLNDLMEATSLAALPTRSRTGGATTRRSSSRKSETSSSETAGAVVGGD